MTALLETEQVEYNYPDGNSGLRGINFSLLAGRKIAVVGANGAGKSTLFLHLNGLLKPRRGVVRFRGKPIDYSRRGLRELRSHVGLVFQDPDAQLFSASVEQDISFGPLNMGLPEAEVRRRVNAAMAATGITELRHRPVHALSYGQKKRVCIAGVAAMRPQVIILDEPLAWLDPAGAKSILDLLEQLNQEGTTIVMSLHQMDIVARWSDEVVLLDQGQRLFQGAPRELFARQDLLTQAGLELPWPMALYQALAERSILPPPNELKGAELPMDQESLLPLIEQAWLSHKESK
ncbi:cobalt transport protein ATP-binding subunit cbio [Heliomicrobium modesticaldum Ice1]|uniref:ABC transporter ATP-binding protein n=1 Tax=Heliobacterium modesticaldum (strain ATCC 51547 / Ice1) TaxID=498761 RepID=B0TDW4_HELMI|nr:ATP-binding cassette domain-containing protein [Heliomicrobium modesticaldum]ABZ82827.1 cobalt transport protein ATP-binding subunit cbio [Heliomicrobium modesticaldum Ice1]